MPWRECKMDKRLWFVACLLEGEKMAAVCREIDIARAAARAYFEKQRVQDEMQARASVVSSANSK
jgi:hypothetical protein